MSSSRLLIRARILNALVKLNANGAVYGDGVVRLGPLRNRMIGAEISTGRQLFLRRHFHSEETGTESTSFNVQDYDDFRDRVLNSQRPVIVDFHADWCMPCKSLGPRLESLVDARNGRVLLAKVNVDDNQELAMDYGVQAVPTLLAFKDGEKVSELIGAVGDVEIRSLLNNMLNEDV